MQVDLFVLLKIQGQITKRPHLTIHVLALFRCITHAHCALYNLQIFNKLTSVFYASVLLLIRKFVITLSK